MTKTDEYDQKLLRDLERAHIAQARAKSLVRRHKRSLYHPYRGAIAWVVLGAVVTAIAASYDWPWSPLTYYGLSLVVALVHAAVVSRCRACGFPFPKLLAESSDAHGMMLHEYYDQLYRCRRCGSRETRKVDARSHYGGETE